MGMSRFLVGQHPFAPFALFVAFVFQLLKATAWWEGGE